MTSAPIALLLGLLVGLFGGWKASAWHSDSVNLAVTQAAIAIRDDAVARESGIAKQVLDAAAARAPAERIIDRGIIREIQKPIYQRVCFDPELVRLLNDGAKGSPAVSVSGEPAGAVP